MAARRMYQIKDRYPTLRDMGIATQHFPRYIARDYHPHGLDVILISFIFEGNCVHMIDDEEFPSSGPTLGLTHLDQHHGIVTDDAGIEITNIYLDPERVALPCLPPPLSDVLPRILPLRPVFANRLNRILRIDLGNGARILNLVRGLHRELEACLTGYKAAAMDYFRLFIMEICRYALESGIEMSFTDIHPNHNRLEKVRAYLELHYRDEVTLDDLADIAGFNPNYLCRLFKEYSGKTIMSYLIDRRIQAAMLQLRSTDTKILDVAYDCGFRDLSYFNRTFRRLVGLTPGKYRVGEE